MHVIEKNTFLFCFMLLKCLVRPNKKDKFVSGNGLTGLKILGRVSTQIFIFFWKKNKILCILKGISPFKMHKIIFFQKT